jgi:hypothetical protein
MTGFMDLLLSEGELLCTAPGKRRRTARRMPEGSDGEVAIGRDF